MAMAETMTTTCRSKHSIRADSHAITKTKPKIRIVHLLAPEVIETDPANFRDLVQRLTGKQAVREGGKKSRELGTDKAAAPDERRRKGESRRVEVREWRINGRIKEEEEEEGKRIGSDSNESCGDLLGELGELDGFIEEFLEFPQEPNSGSTSYAELFGESPLSS